MAKRMFNPDIVSSDAFIEMSTGAQSLYFHLGMRADDDGFVNPNVTMRMIGANVDDLKLLIAKSFLIRFENGVVVVKHWRMNNFIRKDRYKPTNYTEEKNLLFVKENDAYTLDEMKGIPVSKSPWKSDQEKRLSSGQPDVIPLVNAGKDRIGKNSSEKVVKSVSKKSKLNEEYETSFQEFWVIYPEKVAKGKAYDTWKLLSDEVKQLCITSIKNQVDNNHFWKEWKKEDVPPHPTTWLNQRRWEDTVRKIIKPEEIKVVKI